MRSDVILYILKNGIFFYQSSLFLISKIIQIIFININATPTVQPTTTINSPTASSNIDPVILGAVIGGVSAIIAAIIAGSVTVYQIRRTIRAEQNRHAEQLRHEAEMLRLQRELEAQFKAK